MLENYTKLSNGVIKQLNINKIKYDYDYSNKYNGYGEKGIALAHLRYGVLIGVLGRTPKSIVDVGYGNGDFLKVSVKNVKESYGCDISDYPVPDGVKKIDFSDISNIEVTCFFDSLEHFEDIYEIKKINSDYIFISLPNCHYLSDEWFENWYHRRENEHLYHFNKESLCNFMSECGYTCIYTSNFEDIVRFNPKMHPLENILSCVFKKNYI
jgi:hypothetical protein